MQSMTNVIEGKIVCFLCSYVVMTTMIFLCTIWHNLTVPLGVIKVLKFREVPFHRVHKFFFFFEVALTCMKNIKSNSRVNISWETISGTYIILSLGGQCAILYYIILCLGLWFSEFELTILNFYSGYRVPWGAGQTQCRRSTRSTLSSGKKGLLCNSYSYLFSLNIV